VYNADVKPILALLAISLCAPAADLRVGVIGTDTSHVSAFTKLLNGDPNAPDHLAGARVVAAYKGGSKDIEESIGRVDKFAEEIKTQYGVEIVPDIPTLLSKVDVVLLESLDGRVHLEQARPVIAAHKPLFIDKPLAATLEDGGHSVVQFVEPALWRHRGRHDETARPQRRRNMGPRTLRGASSAGISLVCDSSGGIAVHHDGNGLRERHAHRRERRGRNRRALEGRAHRHRHCRPPV
jgi:hypothetical protein